MATHPEMFVPADLRRRWPEGGPGVLGPWRSLTREKSDTFQRRARAGATAAGLVVAIHCLPTIF